MAKKNSLEKYFNSAKEDYAKMGFDENSWQWIDGGMVYAIWDYLSMMGELTDEDQEFIKKVGIEGVVDYILNDIP